MVACPTSLHIVTIFSNCHADLLDAILLIMIFEADIEKALPIKNF